MNIETTQFRATNFTIPSQKIGTLNIIRGRLPLASTISESSQVLSTYNDISEIGFKTAGVNMFKVKSYIFSGLAISAFSLLGFGMYYIASNKYSKDI